MAFRECLANAERDGDITPDRAARIREILEEEEGQVRLELGDEADVSSAAARALERFDAEAQEAARRKRLMMDVAGQVRERILARRNAAGELDPGGELPDLIENFGTSPHRSVNGVYRAVLGQLHRRLDDALFKFERDLLGRTRNPALLKNMVRELFGENTGDASARELAQAYGETFEEARIRRNELGGNTAKREDWGGPQSHDQLAVAGVKRQEWVDYVMDRVDRAKMIDRNTGRAITEQELEKSLHDIYEAIVSNGWSKREAGFAGGGMALARRRAEARFLVFKNADVWLEYQERFGAGDPFNAFNNHIDQMAREIAQMEVLGPNPSAMLRFAENVATKEAAEGRAQARTLTARAFGLNDQTRPRDRVRSEASLMRRMSALFTGTAQAPTDGTFARALGTLVNFKVSTNLGAAFLSAVSDASFSKMARAYNGLPETGATRAILRHMNPANEADKKLAVRSGLIADEAVSLMIGQARYTGDFAAHQWSRRLADTTLRASFLSPWTQAGRWAFGMEFFGHVADQAGKAFDELDAPFRQFFERHGMDARDWELIRSARRLDEGAGGGFITPETIAELTDELQPGRPQAVAERFLEAVHSETQFAVPSATLRGQAYFTPEGLQPGTFMHAIVRSVSMYKSFAVTVLLQHAARGRAELARAGGIMAGRYAAKFLTYTTLFGALSLQLKEISKGRDPRPMTSPQFWGAAMLQGGGLGIFGDFLFSDINRFGGGLPSTIAGPLADFGGDVINLTAGNVLQLATGQETNIGSELTNFIRRNSPGGSIWYLRLAYDRMALDSLQESIDPEAPERFRRQVRRYERDLGQDYWWAPGTAGPQRGPDLSNAVAPAPEQ